MAKSKKSKKSKGKHVPAGVLMRRYARNERRQAALLGTIKRRVRSPSDPNDRNLKNASKADIQMVNRAMGDK